MRPPHESTPVFAQQNGRNLLTYRWAYHLLVLTACARAPLRLCAAEKLAAEVTEASVLLDKHQLRLSRAIYLYFFSFKAFDETAQRACQHRRQHLRDKYGGGKLLASLFNDIFASSSSLYKLTPVIGSRTPVFGTSTKVEQGESVVGG